MIKTRLIFALVFGFIASATLAEDQESCKAIMCLSDDGDVPPLCIPIRKPFFDLPTTSQPKRRDSERYKHLQACVFDNGEEVIESILKRYGNYPTDPATKKPQNN